MLNLKSNSTNKEIKNHRNMIYFCLTGVLGNLRNVVSIQRNYLNFLETEKRNNNPRITFTDSQMESNKRFLSLLESLVSALSKALEFYRTYIFTKEKK